MRRSYLKIRLRHPAEGIPLSPSDGPKFKKGDIVEAKQAGGGAYILAKIVSVDASASGGATGLAAAVLPTSTMSPVLTGSAGTCS
jgi:hypothetical protein